MSLSVLLQVEQKCQFSTLFYHSIVRKGVFSRPQVVQLSLILNLSSFRRCVQYQCLGLATRTGWCTRPQSPLRVEEMFKPMSAYRKNSKIDTASTRQACGPQPKRTAPHSRHTSITPGAGGNPLQAPNRPNCTIFRHRIWPVNTSKFTQVHPDHFATILRFLGCPVKF